MGGDGSCDQHASDSTEPDRLDHSCMGEFTCCQCSFAKEAAREENTKTQ